MFRMRKMLIIISDFCASYYTKHYIKVKNNRLFCIELFGRMRGALEWLQEVPDKCNMDT